MRRRAWVHIAAVSLSGNSLRQTVHTYRVSVHQAAKLGPALLRVARVTAGLAESNGRNDLDVSKLQSALDLTADWANDCQLSVSVDKCSVLLLKLVMAQQ